MYFATSYLPVKLFKAFMNEGVKQVSGLLVFMSPQGNFYNSWAETRHFKAEIQLIAIFWGDTQYVFANWADCPKHMCCILWIFR